jgi:hypothetical protein
MAKVEADKWYLTVVCRNPECQRGMAFGEGCDSPDQPQALPDKLQFVCAQCGTAGEWEPTEVRYAQGQQRH